jgi:hypothetical protein
MHGRSPFLGYFGADALYLTGYYTVLYGWIQRDGSFSGREGRLRGEKPMRHGKAEEEIPALAEEESRRSKKNSAGGYSSAV